LANHKSAIKRARQDVQRNLRNRIRRTRMKNAIKAAEQAAATESREAALQKLTEAVSTIDRTASHGVIHRNKAARTVSRLTRRVRRTLDQREEAAGA
jgi:small subunit ribosomal protein S20